MLDLGLVGTGMREFKESLITRPSLPEPGQEPVPAVVHAQGQTHAAAHLSEQRAPGT
jgi:hypothetical protein